MHWSLCCTRVCVLMRECVRARVCLWACDSVSTSQFNLLKIYVHPALPPLAPPQALNVSTAIPFWFLSCPSSPVLNAVEPFLNYFRRFGLSFQVCWVQFLKTFFIKLWLGWSVKDTEGGSKEGARLNLSCPAESWRVRYLCHTVASRWAELCWAERGH